MTTGPRTGDHKLEPSFRINITVTSPKPIRSASLLPQKMEPEPALGLCCLSPGMPTHQTPHGSWCHMREYPPLAPPPMEPGSTWSQVHVECPAHRQKCLLPSEGAILNVQTHRAFRWHQPQLPSDQNCRKNLLEPPNWAQPLLCKCGNLVVTLKGEDESPWTGLKERAVHTEGHSSRLLSGMQEMR